MEFLSVFQDAGQIIPGGVAVIVKTTGPPKLCQADEVGELCLYSHSTGSSYWGLDGLSANVFKVVIVMLDLTRCQIVSCG